MAWPYVPLSVAAAQLNLCFALTAMAVDRAALVEQFAESRVAAPGLLGFIPKVDIQPDPALDTLGHAFRYAMRMPVRTTNGRIFRRESRHCPGSPESASMQQQLIDKFRLLAAPVLSEAVVARVITVVSGLDRLDDAAQLVDMLVPA